MVPGRLLHRLAAVLLPKDICERVIESQLADFQHEWLRATSMRLRLIALARGYRAFWWTLPFCAAQTIGVAHAASSDDRRALIRTAAFTIAITLVVMTLMVWLPLQSLPDHVNPRRLAALRHVRLLIVVLNLIPQALPLAVPAGLTLGILCGFRRGLVSRRARRQVLAIAVTCCAGSFITLAWVMPAANQAFRVAVVGDGSHPMKGENELTLGDLNREIGSLQREGFLPRARRWLFVYHLRWALSCAPLALAIFALAVVRAGAVARLSLGVGGCATYLLLVFVGEQYVADGTLPPLAGAWLANALVAALSIAIIKISKRPSLAI